MKRFAFRFFLALLAVAIGDRLIGSFLRISYEQTTSGAIGRKNDILHRVHTDILVLGSSRALHHYVPEIITEATGLSCYNCGQGGQGIIYHYALLRTITERYMPKAVVYEITFDYDLASSDNTRFLGEIRNIGTRLSDSVLYDVNAFERVKMLSAIYPYNSQLFHIFGDRIQRKNLTQFNGYQPKYGRLKADAAYKGRQFATTDIDPVKWKYFEKFVREYSRSTKLMVVSSPLYKTQRPDIYRRAEDLCKKLGVPFINRSADLRFINNPAYYHDVSHFNDEGARAYTQSVAGEIKRVVNGSYDKQ